MDKEEKKYNKQIQLLELKIDRLKRIKEYGMKNEPDYMGTGMICFLDKETIKTLKNCKRTRGLFYGCLLFFNSLMMFFVSIFFLIFGLIGIFNPTLFKIRKKNQ